MSNREKALLVDALKHPYTLAELMVELKLARSSYFYHRARQRMPDMNAEIRTVLSEVFHGNPRCYGYRRMHAALGRREFNISEKVVQRLMKQECLIVTVNKKRRYGSYLGEISPMEYRASLGLTTPTSPSFTPHPRVHLLNIGWYFLTSSRPH